MSIYEDKYNEQVFKDIVGEFSPEDWNRQSTLFPPGDKSEERRARKDRKALVDYFVEQQRQRRMARGIDTPSDQDPAINPDALLNRNFFIPRQLHEGGGLMYEGGERFGKSPRIPEPAFKKENWDLALDMLMTLMPGGIGARAIKPLLKPLFRDLKKMQFPLFKKSRRKTDKKEPDKIDPAEYDKWSDEVSRNAPDPTPKDLLGRLIGR